jgi:hypothetical protein
MEAILPKGSPDSGSSSYLGGSTENRRMEEGFPLNSAESGSSPYLWAFLRVGAAFTWGQC